MSEAKAKVEVLVIEDDSFYLTRLVRRIGMFARVEGVPTIEQAKQAFNLHKASLKVIVVDGCVPGDELNTLPLIKYFRTQGYKGALVAASTSREYRLKMMGAGCDYESPKSDAHASVQSIMGR